MSLAIILGVGGFSSNDEGPAVPSSPAAALSLEQVAPAAPIEVMPLSDHRTQGEPLGSAGRSYRIGQDPERFFAVMTLLLVMLNAGGPRRTTTAVASIRKDLRDNLFSDVTHSDLASIEETLVELAPAERRFAVEGLSDREVAVWMRELDGFQGSYSPEEEARLFGGLVPGLGKRSLARFVVGGKGSEVIAALSANGTSWQAVALAGELAAVLETSSRKRRVIPDLLDVADPAMLESEVGGWMHRGELPERLADYFGVPQQDEETGYRLDAPASLARAGAEFSAPETKAALFVELVRAMTTSEGRRWAGTRDDLLAGTTQLLRSDVAGVMGRLNHGADPHGNVLSQWVEEMIDAERIDELDVIFAELLGRDRLAHFAAPGVNPADPYPNASNLGYFVGSYQLAIERMADDDEATIELLGLLFAIVTGVIPGPKGGSLSLPLGPLVDLHAREVIERFQGQATEVKQAVWGLAKPRTDRGLLWNGEGTTQFQDAWEEVVEVR